MEQTPMWLVWLQAGHIYPESVLNGGREIGGS